MDNEIDIKYINSHDGNDRVVGPNYPNSKAYVALSEYERLQEENERLQEENERNQEAASNYNTSAWCMRSAAGISRRSTRRLSARKRNGNRLLTDRTQPSPS